MKNRVFAICGKCIAMLIFLSGVLPVEIAAQTNPNEAEWSGFGYSIKKIVSNTTIASGVNFSYTIVFSAQTGVSSISIQDIVPSTLDIVSVTAAGPVLGVNPVIAFNNITKIVTYNLTSLPATGPPNGSFTIVVKFPEGVTCNGAAARNRAGIQVNGEWQWTPYVTTSATAADPWKVSKTILSGAVVDPNGGNCGYLMEPGDTVTYRLTVTKANGYWGNVIGQQNMSGAVVRDTLPAGASFVSSTCLSTISSTPTIITWQVNTPTQLLDAATPYASYSCDIKIAYPSSSFPLSTQIFNRATLFGTTCTQQVTHTSNRTCITVSPFTPLPNAYLAKYIGLTNRVPGCSGYYLIVIHNSGSVPLTAFNINDTIPGGVTVNQIQMYGASATTPINIKVNNASYATGITSNYYSSNITSPLTTLQYQMTGTFPAGSYLHFYIYFTVNPNPTGTIVKNCAYFVKLANSLNLPPACVSFTVDAGAPTPCLLKDVCSPLTSYNPGDIVRFRLRVQNIGSAALTGAVIQDALHTNFLYVGNETYYKSSSYNPPCSTGGTPPSGATAWTGVSPSHSGNNLSWSLPSIASNCQLFYNAYCGYYGTYGIPYYYIEFDARVDSFALPGVTPNFYKISGGNLTGSVTSNTVNVLVVATFGQEVSKFLSTDNGANFSSSGTTTPGSVARFRLNYKNLSNVGVTNLRLVDLLARNDSLNDWLIFMRTVPRGSQFDISYIGNHTTSLLPAATPPVPALFWAPGKNICLPPYVTSGCNVSTWGSTPYKNVRMDYGSFMLGPNKNIREDFDIGIPGSAQKQQKVCNDFAAVASANFLLNGVSQSVALTPVAAPPVCLVIDTSRVTCCDSVMVEPVQNAAGNLNCCAKLTATCEVKTITVTVTNGTLSWVNWSCSAPVPSGYAGQTSFTFATGNCVPVMKVCATPATSGTVFILFDILFANGERCKKEIKLDCAPTPTNCCESVTLVQVQNPTGAGCCVKLKTTCKVKAVDVTVTNGFLSSTTWNCSIPVPSGFIGLSNYTFAPNGCVLEMVNCANPNSSGLVVFTYFIYFENGETCEKKIEIKCTDTPENCCDSVRVTPVFNAAGVRECCAKITTTCQVRSVNVLVTNGVLSSTVWNCGPLPTGYAGQASYTFAPNGCVLDMTNCVKPDGTGPVSITYQIVFANGERCEKKINLDCGIRTCCERVQLTAIQGAECCARLVTDCKVKYIQVELINGTISAAGWNCGALPSGYTGQSSFTFPANGCVVDLKLCAKPSQTGSVVINYLIVFENGERCIKSIKLNCNVYSSCCALVDFKLKTKWPNWKTQIGTFHVTNIDPSVPICYIEITPSPSGTFSTAGLTVDGLSSGQSWNPSRIPSSGNLSPAAIHTVDFSLISTGYTGTIRICVVKCDGTRCCFDFKWNQSVLTQLEVGVKQITNKTGLVAVSISPVVKTPYKNTIKYLSFGLSDAKEAAENGPEFFAISATPHEGDDYPDNLAPVDMTYMSKHNAFFSLRDAKSYGEDLLYFNLVFTKKLPKIGCTLYDPDGNILYAGTIAISASDTVTSAQIIEAGTKRANMFEFINLYPNPNGGSFKITYATGEERDVEIRVITSTGQLVHLQKDSERTAGIHLVDVQASGLSAGLYKVILYSGGEVKSKSLVIK